MKFYLCYKILLTNFSLSVIKAVRIPPPLAVEKRIIEEWPLKQIKTVKLKFFVRVPFPGNADEHFKFLFYLDPGSLFISYWTVC